MKNILVIATHPDDEVLGCGGTIARHTAAGDSVAVLVVTRGVYNIFPEQFIKQGRRELEDACQILGVAETQFLDFPAPKLDTIPGHELADSISRVISTLRPEKVYLPHRGDIHADHQAVHQATLVAARPVEDCPVLCLMAYETLSETEWGSPTGDMAFVPTVFVDISGFLETKLAAMNCYRSQIKSPPHPRSLAAVEALARFRGSTVSVDAAEAFMLVRKIVRS